MECTTPLMEYSNTHTQQRFENRYFVLAYFIDVVGTVIGSIWFNKVLSIENVWHDMQRYVLLKITKKPAKYLIWDCLKQ